jgi:hypothetical protein
VHSSSTCFSWARRFEMISTFWFTAAPGNVPSEVLCFDLPGRLAAHIGHHLPVQSPRSKHRSTIARHAFLVGESSPASRAFFSAS